MFFKKIFYRIRAWVMRFKAHFFSNPQVPSNPKGVPIIINNYNRLDCLLLLTEALTSRGYYNIHIIDNASTYPPLLEYYKTCPHTVHRFDVNYGHKSLWRSGLISKFRRDYYVYTDPDVVPVEECPDDFIEYFLGILGRYKNAVKVGFGLLIDDLPDHYDSKQKVMDWEARHWEQEVEPGVYRAPIDTTFALYRPWSYHKANLYVEQYRTGRPYAARHLPWYTDSANPSEEDKYYSRTIATSSHWTPR